MWSKSEAVKIAFRDSICPHNISTRVSPWNFFQDRDSLILNTAILRLWCRPTGPSYKKRLRFYVAKYPESKRLYWCILIYLRESACLLCFVTRHGSLFLFGKDVATEHKRRTLTVYGQYPTSLYLQNSGLRLSLKLKASQSTYRKTPF